MNRIVFSEAARDDRRAITNYTIEHFGLDQARRLRDAFERTLATIAETPSIGRTSQELDPPGRTLRSFVLMKRFIIVYEVRDEVIHVARLLHGARNLAAELDREAGNDD